MSMYQGKNTSWNLLFFSRIALELHQPAMNLSNFSSIGQLEHELYKNKIE
jgi:hypothetical protein